MLQAEFALTQVFDRPVQGRVFFEEVMRRSAIGAQVLEDQPPSLGVADDREILEDYD